MEKAVLWPVPHLALLDCHNTPPFRITEQICTHIGAQSCPMRLDFETKHNPESWTDALEAQHILHNVLASPHKDMCFCSSLLDQQVPNFFQDIGGQTLRG